VAFDPPRADEIATIRELREDTQETAIPNSRCPAACAFGRASEPLI
jgi:hypothetical protein